ncbi:MAG: cell wall metabolism sensor histidine kinase WalK [Clostridia bacterium]|nr:cell wall metabolism sensor histidine kinase WalK [Clostridia bacterium]
MKRIWTNASITTKIFLLTAVMFCIYIFITFFLQVFFYGKIYIYYKKEELAKQVEQFSKEYAVLDDPEEINSSMVDFSNSNDSYLLVMNDSGNILYAASYEMTVLTEDGQNIRISLDNAVRDKAFSDLKLKKGSYITVQYSAVGEVNDGNIYFPIKISNSDGSWRINGGKQGGVRMDIPDNIGDILEKGKNINISIYGEDAAPPSDGGETHFSISEFELVSRKASGIITSITLPDERNSQASMRRAESARAALLWINRLYEGETLNIGQKIHYIYKNGESGDKYMVVVKKIEKDGLGQMIFAVTTLKSVDEAVEVMQGSHILWFFVAFFVVVAMSIIFSQLVTRPILNITQVTTKMKNLDFSQKCEVHSQDEVGKLAQNINDMSTQLDATIHELMDANEKLMSDIERERKIELQRKEFVAAVSHELKTPLAIIRAYSEGLNDNISSEKRERYLNVIVDETKKMDALVLDMLENSRLEAGVQKLDIKEHDICPFLKKIVSRFEHNCAEKDIRMILNFSSDEMKANFDSGKIEQVVTNFITNAIRHTPNGHKIYVSVSEKGTKKLVCVENEGKHIPENELDKVWDRFYKIDKSRDRSMGGTGLGLSIAKNILLLHKAAYGVENTDKGVRFWFLI